MTNSDYILKAAIKKLTEKLNELVIEKFEEAAVIAQDAPEIIKKEFDTLKEAIIEEAARMEKEMKNSMDTESVESNQDPKLREIIKEVEEIKEKIEQFNIKINNRIYKV